MKRITANRVILTIIAELMEQYPDLRFGQLLYGTNILRQDKDGKVIDIFSEEPDITLQRVDKFLNKLT